MDVWRFYIVYSIVYQYYVVVVFGIGFFNYGFGGIQNFFVVVVYVFVYFFWYFYFLKEIGEKVKNLFFIFKDFDFFVVGIDVDFYFGFEF